MTIRHILRIGIKDFLNCLGGSGNCLTLPYFVRLTLNWVKGVRRSLELIPGCQMQHNLRINHYHTRELSSVPTHALTRHPPVQL